MKMEDEGSQKKCTMQKDQLSTAIKEGDGCLRRNLVTEGVCFSSKNSCANIVCSQTENTNNNVHNA
jgi:hypothetical protein